MTNSPIDSDVRVEVDGLGAIKVPTDAYWGASTQRAVENFAVSGKTIGSLRSLIWALGAIKKASAKANEKHQLLPAEVSEAIQKASQEVMDAEFDDHFVVDRVQGGAGTSTNMNANEVIANRATELRRAEDPASARIHPIDEVNRCQSTNDVYPTAIKLALVKELHSLRSEYNALAKAFYDKASEFTAILKVGRTQLQDAVPMTLGQEFTAFAATVQEESDAVDELIPKLLEINLGGTAIGTGITAPKSYSDTVVAELNEVTQLQLHSAPNLIKATSDTGSFVATSSALRRAAIKLSKIANDLRLLSSGPQAGLAEITLPAVQPGSSIMPGKINPVIPEMVNQVAFRIIGTDTTIMMAAEAGQLQLNAFEPIMADGIMESIIWLTRALKIFRARCVNDIQANTSTLEKRMRESVCIITALTPVIGYMAAAELAQETLTHGGSVVEKALERELLTREQVDDLLSLQSLTGISNQPSNHTVH